MNNYIVNIAYIKKTCIEVKAIDEDDAINKVRNIVENTKLFKINNSYLFDERLLYQVEESRE